MTAPGPRGFTFLEVMLATAITAVLAASLYAAMYVGFRARLSARAQTAAAREAAVTLDLIERELQSLLPPTGVLSGAFLGYAMGHGGWEADSLEFHALGSDPDAPRDDPLREGIRRVQIVLRQDVNPPTLVRRVDRNLLAPTREAVREEPLASGLKAFAVRYYNGYAWQSEWDSTLMQNRLPLAVEVTVELGDATLGGVGPYVMTRTIPLSAGRPVDPSTGGEP